jgi:peptidoglycan/LPS O-acetylase OafA/YrhL
VTQERVEGVDGLRAVAAFGVVWAHVWMFAGNPPLMKGLLPVDVHQVIGFVGTGVDLFFVISGFCMYLMLDREAARGERPSLAGFIKRRFRRIAPAYYAAVLFAGLAVLFVEQNSVELGDVAAHLFFLNGVVPGTVHFAPPFWSLATEWQFYIVLPLFMILGTSFGVARSLLVLAVAALISRVALVVIFPEEAATLAPQLPMRLIEFVWGMIVAWRLRTRVNSVAFFDGISGALFGLVVAFAGRMLMTRSFVEDPGVVGILSRCFAEPILSLGYALVLWGVISRRSALSDVLAHPVMVKLGNWSYGVYVWHWFVASWMTTAIVALLGQTALAVWVSFAILVPVLAFLGMLSFRVFERSYFATRNRMPAVT